MAILAPTSATNSTTGSASAAPGVPKPARPAGATWRLAFVLPAGGCLLLGLDAALLLLGVPAPLRADRLPDVHGMLLVFGFVGTLVSLERAVALGRLSGFVAPGLLATGGLLLVSPAPLALGQGAQLLGAAALVGVYVPLWRRQRDDAVLVQALGAVLGTGALLLWRGGAPVPTLVPWLAAFVVLTIAGERLELARITMGPSAGTRLLQLASALIGAVVATLLWPEIGQPLLGVIVLTLVVWLARHDVATKTIRSRGLTRFMAASMLAGYAWLAVAGGVWALAGPVSEGTAYDAVIHAVFLGFTMSMIMAHAPVILPAVLRRPLPYHPVLLVPAALLQLSLVIRLWWGDARDVEPALQVGGVLNVAALLGFFLLVAWSATRPAMTRSATRGTR